MEYINCFQITSLVLVTMIAIHYFSHKRLNNAENRNFVCFLAFSGVYVLLDMLSAVIAGGGSSEGCRMSALVLTLYYFCDVILTYGLFCYIRIITGRQKEKYKWLKTGWVVLPAAMLLAVTANLRTGWLFYFDQEGRFIRGSILFYAGDRCIYVTLWKNSRKRNTAHHMEILVYRSSLPVSPDCCGKNTAYRLRTFCRTLADLSYYEQSR